MNNIIDFRFNWGSRMQNLSNEILKLLQGGEALKQARLKALKITNEIQGFGSGSSLNSPTSTVSSPSSFSSDQLGSPGSSSFCSFSTNGSPKNVDEKHLWNGPAIEEILIDSDDDVVDDDYDGKPKGFVSEMCSKIIGGNGREKIEFRCISDVGRKVPKKSYDRQYSHWF